ncbi:MAG TPA: hypothetical protein VGQ53_16235 [Chitinophagaceae bacterium]|jgi:hypothetical protein|nr:hypothetical protein [Chitinophagaceae bacterium]
MKAIKSTVFATAFLISITISAQRSIHFPGTASVPSINADSCSEKISQRRVNFYVVNKPKTLDFFSRMVVLRARKKGMTRRDKFVVIVATSAKEARDKMEDHLQKKNAMIGSLWFDTHGRYANGYSSFILGKDEFSYKTINDTAKMKDFRALASYCDEWTRVAIGSCYGGATYEKPAHNGKPATRMNGDSLMIGLANLLPTATIYGTEGWVMTKPGIFRQHSYALAGYPLQKRFKDEVYKPVWEHLGIWHSYSTTTKRFEVINTLSLTRMGSIHVKEVTYLDREKSKQRLEKNLAKLRPGLLKS